MVPWLLAVQLVVGQGSPPALLQFEWNAPPECPATETLLVRLGYLSGTASATVHEDAGGWQLEVRAADSVRQLSAKTCDEAADATVLIVRLALEPATRRPLSASSVVESPLRAPAIVPGPVAVWTIHAAAAGGASLAWLPAPVVRVGATVSARRGPLALGADITTGLEQRYAGGPTAISEVALRVAVDGQLHACWLFGKGRVSAGPCLQAALTSLDVSGVNVTGPRSSKVLLWSGGGGVRASFRLGSWLEALAGAGMRTGTRPSVSFLGTGPVVQAGPVAVDLWAGLGGFL